MPVDIKIPEMGESVTSGVIARWIKAEGETVARDEPVLELETDKITAEIPAPAAGRVKHAAKAGDTVAVGAVVGRIEEGGAQGMPAPAQPPPPPPGRAANGKADAAAQAADAKATPLAKKLAEEHGVNLAALVGTGTGGKVREQDVLAAVASRTTPRPAPPAASPTPAAARLAAAALPAEGVRRERLSPLRQRIAARLVEAQHAAAMLTTFNEVDMTAVMALRARYKDEFEKAHGVGLGFMSFFVKAATSALRAFPVVNAGLVQGADGTLEVEHRAATHVAVAVSTPKGLTVPVLRNTHTLSFAQIETGIKDLATRARDGKLALEDLQGGTFTITNGGVFGSLLSTPILNAPQSAILGMHAIKNRAVEHPDKPGEIALRPMMYLAVSYDHRLLDGADAVRFLVHIKQALERPERLLIGL